MTTRRIRSVAFCGALLAGAFALLDHPSPVLAQQPSQYQITSISVGADQTITYPSAAPASPWLLDLPDEHTTIVPPATSGAPYLFFSSSAISTAWGGTVALQSTDLKTLTFATALGYSPQVMASPVSVGGCSPTLKNEFDQNYAGQVFIDQDPTLPPGNLVMLYEAENHCQDGITNAGAGYASVGFTRSSDNGKTWPAPENGGLSGGVNRYPVIQPLLTPNTGPTDLQATQAESGLIDKSLDGNYYLYATFSDDGPTVSTFGVHLARAALGTNHPTFMKWYNGAFSEPGLGGKDTTTIAPLACGGVTMGAINYVDDIGVYLLTYLCTHGTKADGSGAWYYSTATSLDLEDWTTPQVMVGSEYPVTTCANGGGPQFDGYYPSLMSPGAAVGHIKLTGTAFYLQGCIGPPPRIFTSRTFTITTQPQPAPVLTSGSLANGATYASGGLVPGSWAQVKGTGLSNITRLWTGYDFLNLGSNLPTSLSGVQVMVNNLPAAVYYISPTQIDFQVPTGVSGTASVQVIVNGAASNTLTASSAASAPGLFPNTVNGVNYPAAVFALSGGFVGPNNSGYRNAFPGNSIELYATGLLTEPGGVLPTAQPISGVTVTIGNITVPADFAGQTPYVGEFQINFTVPGQFATMPAGNYPISIAVNGVSSPTTINTSPPGLLVLPVTP